MDASKAAVEFLLRKMAISHPSGHTKKGGKWYPTTEYDCCKSVRSPSRAYPWSLYTHCKSSNHVAHEYGVSVEDLKEQLKKKNLPLMLGINEKIDAYVAEKLKKVSKQKAPVSGIENGGRF